MEGGERALVDLDGPDVWAVAAHAAGNLTQGTTRHTRDACRIDDDVLVSTGDRHRLRASTVQEPHTYKAYTDPSTTSHAYNAIITAQQLFLDLANEAGACSQRLCEPGPRHDTRDAPCRYGCTTCSSHAIYPLPQSQYRPHCQVATC